MEMHHRCPQETDAESLAPSDCEGGGELGIADIPAIKVGMATLFPTLRVLQWNQIPIRLSEMETALVCILMSRPQSFVPLPSLAEECRAEKGSVKVTISRLRKRLRQIDPAFDAIYSRPGRGAPGYGWKP
jgi:DNA-binding response OmpR family regulator